MALGDPLRRSYCRRFSWSYTYYRAETERIQQTKYEEIAAIGKLKARQISQWRQNQLEDVGPWPRPYVQESNKRMAS